MAEAAEELEFERAARLRDNISALKRALEKQAVVLGDGTDADVVAFADDDLEAAVQVFHVRGGRVRGERGWVADRSDDSDLDELIETFCLQLYSDANGEILSGAVPKEVLLPVPAASGAALADLLCEEIKAKLGIKRVRGDTFGYLQRSFIGCVMESSVEISSGTWRLNCWP